MQISGQELWRRMGSPEVAEQDEPPTLEGHLKAVYLDALESRHSRARFEENIRAAAEAGASTRTIAKAAGLSHQRIHQIIHGR